MLFVCLLFLSFPWLPGKFVVCSVLVFFVCLVFVSVVVAVIVCEVLVLVIVIVVSGVMLVMVVVVSVFRVVAVVVSLPSWLLARMAVSPGAQLNQEIS